MCSCRYYNDTETGWYYLQSRYYDPVIHRFINADSYASTGQGFLGCNMFAYCDNNPVNCGDHTGTQALPFINTLETDAGSAGGGGGAITFYLLYWLLELFEKCVDSFTAPAPAISSPRINTDTDEEERIKAAEKSSAPTVTVIYRYHSTKTSNLAPRAGIDFDGLSFSTIPPSANQYPAVMTTIEAVNATGVLSAVRVGTHVSIIPTTGTVGQWMAEGQNSLWSQALSLIVIEMES